MKPADIDHFYFDGNHYDARTRIDDIQFWVGQAGRYGGPILELAVGTGRIAIPLVEAGFAVTGIDMSDSTLDRAKQKCDDASVSVDLIKADIRDFHLNKRYPLILIPANTIVHLKEIDELEACLTCVKAHLEPEGRLIIDTHYPSIRYLHTEWIKPSTTEYPSPSDDGPVLVTSTSRYDSATQINVVKMTYRLGEKERVDTLEIRLHFPRELEAILRYNGFTLERRIGNYEGDPFHSGSEKQIVVAVPT